MKNSLDVEQIGGGLKNTYPIKWLPMYEGIMPECSLKTYYKKDEILIYNNEGKGWAKGRAKLSTMWRVALGGMHLFMCLDRLFWMIMFLHLLCWN